MKKIYGTYFTKPWRLILSTLFLFFCCGFLANAQCGVADISSPGGIAPVFVSGNPSCSGTTYHFKIDPPTPGTYSLPGGGTVTFTLSTGPCGQVAAWAVSSGVEVYQIIVKGGPNANLYNYDGTLMADGNLHTPVGPNGSYYGVSHMVFCYEFVPPLECNAKATKDVTCLGEDDGEITVNWTGGVGPFNAYLNGVLKGTNVTSPFKFTGLTAGTYICKIVDSRLVETTCGAVVTEPEFALEAEWDGKIPCYGDEIDVTITASGGTSPYELYDGATKVGDFTGNTFTVPNVGEGTYAWTVIDANKCEADVDFELKQPEELACRLALKDPDDPNTIELFVTGGTEPYTITWYFNTVKIAEDVYAVTIIGKGAVKVTVVDANKCYTECDFPKETGLECENIVVDLKCDPKMLPDEDMVIADAEDVYGDEYTITAMQEEGYPKNEGCYWEDLWIITITELGIDVLCEVKYTWTISGLKIFCPDPVELPACTSYDDIVTAYEEWVKGFYFEAGCDATDNIADIPPLPENIFCGGEISFIYEVSDECYDLDCSSTFEVLAPADVVVTPPADGMAEECMDPEDLEDAFAAWIAQGTAVGGCGLKVDVKWDVDPDVCGSKTTVTWTATSDCEDPVIETAIYTVPAPDPVVVTPPADGMAEECMDPDDLAADFAAWIAQGKAVGGCGLKVDVKWDVDPDVCGSKTTVTWTATSDCEDPVIETAIYTVPAPDPVEAFCSNMIHIPQCVTAEEIDGLFAAWKEGFGYTGGCDVKDNKDELMALVWSDFIDVEKGGTVSFTYMVWDACSKDEVTCEFTVPQCIITCETAYARAEEGAECFIPKFANWGWTNPITEGEHVLPMWAAAAKCNIAGLESVGNVYVTYASGKMTVKYVTYPGYSMNDIQTYVGCGKYPKLKNGRETIAPGQYTYVANGLDRIGDYVVEFTNVTGDVWLIAHAVTCDVKAKNEGSGIYAKAINCMSPTVAIAPSNGKKKSASIEGITTTDLRVYPNPFSTKVNFEFVSARDAQARLEIYNGIGQKIASLIDRAVESGVLNRIEYQPQNVISSVLFYRLTLDNDIINGKLLYKK